MARNNRKLRTRFPEKFTESEALTRDLEEERRALEALPILCTAQTIDMQAQLRKNGRR